MATFPSVPYPTLSIGGGPLSGPGAGYGGLPIIGAGAQTAPGPSPLSLAPRPPMGPMGAGVDPMVTGAAGGPNIVSTVPGQPTGGGIGMATLDALMKRQAELAGKTVEMPTMQDPMQGVAYMAEQFMSGLERGKTDRDILAQTAARADILGGLGEGGIASPEQIAAMSKVDPALAGELYKQAMDARAKAEETRLKEAELAAKYGPGGENALKPSDLASLRDDYAKAATTYESAVPSWQSMKQAADLALSTEDEKGKGAADYNMIVAFAKMLDPNSVVREGEVKSASMTEGMLGQIQGWINEVRNAGVLGDDVRRAIMTQANSRMRAYYDQVASKRKWFADMGARNGFNVDDVAPPLAEFQDWVEKKPEEEEQPAKLPPTIRPVGG